VALVFQKSSIVSGAPFKRHIRRQSELGCDVGGKSSDDR
jgi:hypothetical protein